jgi:hypothetical protein
MRVEREGVESRIDAMTASISSREASSIVDEFSQNVGAVSPCSTPRKLRDESRGRTKALLTKLRGCGTVQVSKTIFRRSGRKDLLISAALHVGEPARALHSVGFSRKLTRARADDRVKGCDVGCGHCC